jgi:hypothetical protein
MLSFPAPMGQARGMSDSGKARLPPRWFIVGFWHAHRRLVRATGGRWGLWRPKPDGWGAAEPAWWLNLQANPDATAQTRDGTRQVRARAAEGAERERLWARWAEIDENLDAYAARRPGETAVVVLEPR